MKIIACDFDGTLCENEYPLIGRPKENVINKLKEQKTNGAKLILWTCREDDLLEKAVEWCEKLGIVFDAINDNLGETKEWMKYNSRKVFANEYWDDRSCNTSH